MKPENDEYLCKVFPKMTANRNLPMTETAMCWGFECGDGWFPLINQLMSNIQHHLDWKNKDSEVVPQVVLDQVKEKFGTLRFYYSGGDDYIRGMVAMAEAMSGILCEKCGKPATTNWPTLPQGGWVRTLCIEHGGEDYSMSEEEFLEKEKE